MVMKCECGTCKTCRNREHQRRYRQTDHGKLYRREWKKAKYNSDEAYRLGIKAKQWKQNGVN